MAKNVTLTVRFSAHGDGIDHSDVFQSVNTNGPMPLETTAVAGFNGPYAAGTFGDNMLGGVLVPPNSNSGANPSTSGVGKTIKVSSGETGMSIDPASVFAVITPSGGVGFGVTYAAPEELFIVFV
jgi:hypothetical protein